MKGISTILATILLVIIVVSIVGLTYTFATSIFGVTTTAATSQTTQIVSRLGKQVNIVAASCKLLPNVVKFTIKNVGSADIKPGEMAAFVDGIKVNTTPDIESVALSAGSFSNEFVATFPGKSLNRNLGISAPAGEISKRVDCDFSDNSLVAYWKFDENSGTTAGDSSGKGNSGTLGNETATEPSWLPNAKSGSGLNFTPETSGVGRIKVVNMSSVADDINQSSDFTLAFWVNTTAVTAQYIFSAANTTRDNNILLGIMDGATDNVQLILESAVPNIIAVPAPFLGNGKWQHITIVKFVSPTGTSVELYINGTLYATGTDTAIRRPLTVYNGVWLGNDQDAVAQRFDPGQQLRGFLDEFTIFNKALSDIEVKGLMSYFE